MYDISGSGSQIVLKASNTFRNIPVLISSFADDANSYDLPAIDMGDMVIGPNGDTGRWVKASVITLTINLMPNSAGDLVMSQLVANNLIFKGKISTNDLIEVIITNSTGTQIITLKNGTLTNAKPGHTMGQDGRYQTKPYTIKFGSISVINVPVGNLPIANLPV